MEQEAVGRGGALARRGKVGHVGLPDVTREVLGQQRRGKGVRAWASADAQRLKAQAVAEPDSRCCAARGSALLRAGPAPRSAVGLAANVASSCSAPHTANPAPMPAL